MGKTHPLRRGPVLSALFISAVTVWAVANGRPTPVVAFCLTATVVSAVGVSEGIVEVAPWYYAFETGVLGLFGAGMLLLGYDSWLVIGLTSGFVAASAVLAVRYSRIRRTVPPPENSS